MAAYNKFNCFVEDCTEKVHNLASDTLMVALTDTLPLATNTVLANIVQISYTFCSSRVLTTLSSGQSGGLYKLILQDLVLIASGGNVGPFRYVVVYNDTPTSPLKPLIGWYDYSQECTMQTGEQFTVDCDPTNGILQLS